MTHYFASDIHIRFDKPERSARFARFVDSLTGGDSLVVVGDLYDFWFVSRQQSQAKHCLTAKALNAFQQRGGTLRIMSGNHDQRLERFVAETIGLRMESNPIDLEIGGKRFHIEHGHMLSRLRWKAFMESNWFLQVFSRLPHSIARRCDERLDNRNEARFAGQRLKQMALFRRLAETKSQEFDVVIVGHLHARVDELIHDTRLFVLGDWKTSSSFLAVNTEEIVFHEITDAETLAAAT